MGYKDDQLTYIFLPMSFRMSASEAHKCQCPKCRETADHPERDIHRQMNLFLNRLDEQQHRWYVAMEANRIGHGGIALLSKITGMDEKTIQRGQQELTDGLETRPADRVRLPGGGRKPIKKKTR
jgi:hypothetical protein